MARTLEKFTLASLATIDGERIAIAFEQALKRVANDCDDRPGEKKPRTITLQLSIVPVLDAAGIADDCKVQATITDSVPKRKTRSYDMTMKKGGHLMFHPESVDDHSQEVMDFKDDEE